MSEQLLHPDEAVALVLSFASLADGGVSGRGPATETVPTAKSLGRVLATPIAGRIDQPPFDKSAMDGWAWRPADEAEEASGLPARPLRVREVIAAGDAPAAPLASGETAKIMTGAPLPPGATRVQRVEWAEELWAEDPAAGSASRLAGGVEAGAGGGGASAGEASAGGVVAGAGGASAGKASAGSVVAGEGGGAAAGAGGGWPNSISLVRFTKAEGLDNVIRRGENAKSGDIILTPRVLRAQDLAILAADGRAEVELAARPVVGVFSTGSELAEPGAALAPGRIYDSNRTQLLAQLAGAPCLSEDLGALPDDYEATLASLRHALASCELVVLSGGVSMGDFDFVPRALKAAGVRELFHGVAMKPGKPTFFGVLDAAATPRPSRRRAFVFGLPGNPVSVFVNTELLVKPLVYALQGLAWDGLELALPAAEAIRRKGADRVEFLPVSIGPDGARAIRYGGSSAIQALAGADGFCRLEIGQSEIEKGGSVRVRLVR